MFAAIGITVFFASVIALLAWKEHDEVSAKSLVRKGDLPSSDEKQASKELAAHSANEWKNPETMKEKALHDLLVERDTTIVELEAKIKRLQSNLHLATEVLTPAESYKVLGDFNNKIDELQEQLEIAEDLTKAMLGRNVELADENVKLAAQLKAKKKPRTTKRRK